MLLFVDVDRFKYINDTAGHTAGDHLLVEVSARLKSRLRASDHLARMGGDEYAVILRNVTSTDAHVLAEGFRKSLTRAPFAYGGKSYRITVSIGAAYLDEQIASVSEAMANADIALHLAKNGGRNQVHVFAPESARRAAMELDVGWSTRLEEALRADRFVLCFQPMVPLAGFAGEDVDADDHALWERQLQRNPGQPAKFEVLLRLRDPGGELILPGAFLPSAERFGMLGDIDRWVIERAISSLRESRSPRPLVLAINLAAQTLASAGLVAYITDKLVQHNVDPRSLVFEITESRAVASEENLRAPIAALRALGCAIAVDDFGSGFATLGSLRLLDADYLKIDGSLIQGLPHDPLDRAIVAGLTAIARASGKLTVAECVENPRALATLLECGVDFVQGFAVGMPRAQLPGAAGIGAVAVAARRDAG